MSGAWAVLFPRMPVSTDGLVVSPSVVPERVDVLAAPVLRGQWYYVREGATKREPEHEWLGCAMHVGSNYALLRGPHGSSVRVHFNEFDARCRPARDADAYIRAKIAAHQDEVARLLGDVREVTERLGVAAADAPSPEGSTNLAVVSGAPDIAAHKAALVRARDKDLPALFSAIKGATKEVATWLGASVLPQEAEVDAMEATADGVKGHIHAVELYAGLTEEVVPVRGGAPAGHDEQVRLLQCQRYMDEECLVRYQAGGMRFDDVGAFDAWLAGDGNFSRLLPHPRCVVAFRVRRHDRNYDGPAGAAGLGAFIQFFNEREAERRTYLYLRNGDQLHRVSTTMDFGARLFPDARDSTVFSGGALWGKRRWHSGCDEVLSQREYDALRAKRAAEDACEDAHYAEQLAAWEAAVAEAAARGVSPENDSLPGGWRKPFDYHLRNRPSDDEYFQVTPESVYYDDAMRKVSADVAQHNRVAVVLQGLLDRSLAFHPHPRWNTWTAEGFRAAFALVYDDSLTLDVGTPPDFEAFRARLNASLKVGDVTVGQRRPWTVAMAARENKRLDNDWRSRSDYRHTTYEPHGNPGPDVVHRVASLRAGKAEFRWERERRGDRWVRDPNDPGYLIRDRSGIPDKFRCPVAKLLSVSAYRPGDFRQFYEDHRTRTDYLRWAPFLLAAEDWHAARAAEGRSRVWPSSSSASASTRSTRSCPGRTPTVPRSRAATSTSAGSVCSPTSGSGTAWSGSTSRRRAGRRETPTTCARPGWWRAPSIRRGRQASLTIPAVQPTRSSTTCPSS